MANKHLKKLKIGALISGGGTNLQAIIDACESEKIDGQMVFVGSDNSAAKGLNRALNHKIPTFVVDYTTVIKTFKTHPGKIPLPGNCDLDDLKKKQSLFHGSPDPEKLDFFLRTRVIAEDQLLKEIRRFDYDLIVLAGFMRNLTPYFIDQVNQDENPPKIMNIHPALLPAFPGVDGYGDTYRYGCKIGGCTVHFVDYGEDSGPIIGQKCFSISNGESLEEIKEKGLEKEWALYPECIQLYAQNRLKIVNKSHDMGNGVTYQRNIVQTD